MSDLRVLAILGLSRSPKKSSLEGFADPTNPIRPDRPPRLTFSKWLKVLMISNRSRSNLDIPKNQIIKSFNIFKYLAKLLDAPEIQMHFEVVTRPASAFRIRLSVLFSTCSRCVEQGLPWPYPRSKQSLQLSITPHLQSSFAHVKLHRWLPVCELSMCCFLSLMARENS